MVEDFLEKVKKDCIKNDIKLFLHHEKYVVEEWGGCSGYFDAENKMIVVATKKKKSDWLGVLAHEYCHMLQWLRDVKVWTDCFHYGLDTAEIIDLWLKGFVELTNEQKYNYIDRTIKLERDCEQRTVAVIEKYELPIEIDQYIKYANAYIGFYAAMAQYRKWYNPLKAPYNSKRIAAKMPSNLNTLTYSCKGLAKFVHLYKGCLNITR